MNPKRRIIPVFIPHYGCEHECVFCDQRSITGVAAPDIGDVERAIRGKAEAFQPTELAFYGGSFTAIPVERQNELLVAARPFLEQNALGSIRVSTRPDCISEATVARLKGYGVATIELGAQSMCDDVLAASRRGHTASDTVRAAGLIKGSGLALVLQMMTGLPLDTRGKSLYTAQRFTGLEPDGVRVYPTVVVRGTVLHELWMRGEYREHSIESAVELCAEVCAVFAGANIPVIRLGLNPSAALDAGGAVAGAYHPAFGELVYSRMYYNRAAALLEGIAPDSDVTVAVGVGCVSKMTGQRRCNVLALADKFSLRSLKVVGSDKIQGEDVKVICDNVPEGT